MRKNLGGDVHLSLGMMDDELAQIPARDAQDGCVCLCVQNICDSEDVGQRRYL